ncbi:UNVERIFIED_CONTAM: hypothetical protein Sindi_0665300 [Sesamum indicum]
MCSGVRRRDTGRREVGEIGTGSREEGVTTVGAGGVARSLKGVGGSKSSVGSGRAMGSEGFLRIREDVLVKCHVPRGKKVMRVKIVDFVGLFRLAVTKKNAFRSTFVKLFLVRQSVGCEAQTTKRAKLCEIGSFMIEDFIWALPVKSGSG